MKIGSKLKIPINLTVDPYNKRGQTGVLISNKLGIYTIKFDDGTKGQYFANVWTKMAKGGKVNGKNIIKPNYSNNNDVSKENAEMVLNQNTQIKHHTEELKSAVKAGAKVPAWVVAKINRSANDISDATHYLEGTEKMARGGSINTHKSKIDWYYDNEEEMVIPNIDDGLQEDDNMFIYVKKGTKGYVEDGSFFSEEGNNVPFEDEYFESISLKNKMPKDSLKLGNKYNSQNTSSNKTFLTVGATINVDDYIFVNMYVFNRLQDKSVKELTLSKIKQDIYVFKDKNNKIYNVWIYGMYPRPKFKKGDIIDLTKYQIIEKGQSEYCKSYNINEVKVLQETNYNYTVDLKQTNNAKTIIVSKEKIIPINSIPKFDYKIGDFILIDSLKSNHFNTKFMVNEANKHGFNKLKVVGYNMFDETKEFFYEVIGYTSNIPYKTYNIYVDSVQPKMARGGSIKDINNIKKKLDNLGVRYEMSKTDKVTPFKVIYKPIDQSDKFYKEFNNIIDLNNLNGVVELSMNTTIHKNKMQHGGMVNIDYNKLINLIKSANNPKNLPIYYNSSQNVINIGGVGYDKGDLVKMFNSQPGQSLDIKSLFYKANQHPNETKKAIESMSKGIKVEIGYGYGKEPIVKYIK